MDKDAYLKRLKLTDDEIVPDLANLKILQKRHLLNIPFENLDIHWKKPIILNPEKFYGKIIGENRGGFCYELNGLFAELLKEIGFQIRIISARVKNGAKFSPEYDHLAILTKIDGEEYLVDAGFGNFIAEPLKFAPDLEQQDANGIFKIRKHDENYFEVVKKSGENWQSEFIFKDLERDLQEFKDMCEFHQNSPESHFTKGKICSLMTEKGRKTLTDDKFIETNDTVKNETAVNSEEEFDQILKREFQIERIFEIRS